MTCDIFAAFQSFDSISQALIVTHTHNMYTHTQYVHTQYVHTHTRIYICISITYVSKWTRVYCFGTSIFRHVQPDHRSPALPGSLPRRFCTWWAMWRKGRAASACWWFASSRGGNIRSGATSRGGAIPASATLGEMDNGYGLLMGFGGPGISARILAGGISSDRDLSCACCLAIDIFWNRGSRGWSSFKRRVF